MTDIVRLDPILFWQTRSFWFAVGSALAPLARYFELEILPADFAEYMLHVVSLACLLGVLHQRRNPKRRVVLRLPKETSP